MGNIEFKKEVLIGFICYIFIFMLIFNYKVIAGEGDTKEPLPKKIETQNRIVNTPKACFINPDFTFKPIEDGKIVSHDFTIKNIGNATLLIKKVKTDCGCTAVKYDKKIFPGKTGKIEINLDTTGYANKSISKSIKIYTNDPKNSVKELKLSGLVETLVNIHPRVVRLSGNSSYSSKNEMGQHIEMTVKITPVVKYPFSIKGITLNEQANISAQVRASNLPIGSFDVIVRNIRQKPGRYFDQITLKTDSDVIPEIKINVIGNIIE